MLYCFAERPSFFCSKFELDRITFFQCWFSQFLFPTNVNHCFDTTDWKNCKTTKKLLNLDKWYQKEKNFLEREICFPQPIPLKARYPVEKNPEKIFSSKAPTFFYIKVRRRLKHCAIFQKLFILRISERYAGCRFDNHAGNLPLKVQKKLRSKRWKK